MKRLSRDGPRPLEGTVAWHYQQMGRLVAQAGPLDWGELKAACKELMLRNHVQAAIDHYPSEFCLHLVRHRPQKFYGRHSSRCKYFWHSSGVSERVTRVRATVISA